MGKKAIFVDGQSFFHMTRNLGIGSIKFKQFMDILVKEIGDCRDLVEKPLYVINHAGALILRKPISYAGFYLLASRTGSGKDDKAIISRIENLPPDVTEIVLVSTDSDYYPALQAKSESGVKVFVLATEQEQNRRSTLSDLMKESFIFVELAQYKERIMRSEFVARDPNADSEAGTSRAGRRMLVMEVAITMIDVPGIVGNFYADMADIIAKYPGMRAHFDTDSFVAKIDPVTMSDNQPDSTEKIPEALL